jgi:hypothetical protein
MCDVVKYEMVLPACHLSSGGRFFKEENIISLKKVNSYLF